MKEADQSVDGRAGKSEVLVTRTRRRPSRSSGKTLVNVRRSDDDEKGRPLYYTNVIKCHLLKQGTR